MSLKQIIAGSLMSVCLAGTAAAQEVNLKAISFIRLDVDWGQSFKAYVDKVNAECAGKVKINLIGGPEAMNPFEQPAALSNGAVDMIQTIPAFYQRMFPGALAFNLTSKSAADLRGTEGFEFLQHLHNEQVNAHLLAMTGYGIPFHLYLRGKKIDGADLTDLKLRVLPIYRPLFQALGATAIDMNQSELYTALERGVVDGYGYISWGIRGQGWAPVTDYRVDPGFYNTSVTWLVNQDKWASMPKDAQSCMQDLAIAEEMNNLQIAVDRNAVEYADQAQDGIEVIELTGAERDKFLSVATEAGWDDVKLKDPENYAKLREYME